jgi:CRISPR-associated endonuclease/helicase Cas3
VSQLDLSTIEFWAKTTKDGSPGISVLHHTMNVGWVARHLAEQRPRMLDQLELRPDIVALLAALHDLGKISPGFQVKCPAWLDMNGLKNYAILNGWDNLESDHGRVTQFAVQRWLSINFGLEASAANSLAAAVAAHHGRILCSPSGRGMRSDPGRGLVDNDAWEEKRRETANALAATFLDDAEQMRSFVIDKDAPELWWLAGLTSVADWIGSDENHFPTDKNLPVDISREHAAHALTAIGFEAVPLRRALDFEDLFPFPANDLQTQAMHVMQQPGVYVIEAPMGIGKTEAALACAYQLMCKGLADGIYFALPTQMTSNRIHSRLKEFIERICVDAPATRLIHANSWLSTEVNPTTPAATHHTTEDARVGRDWFTSAKRALLAPFGVGTVDQALLSVVAAKHFFVRRFALTGKVVVLDEIHSYDIYTGTLIRQLCRTLEELGCTVILLSGTLTPDRRNELLGNAVSVSDATPDEPYPLISGRATGGAAISPRTTEAPTPRNVHLRFGQEDDLLREVWGRAKDGVCALWICDTVNAAQRVYQYFAELRKIDGGPTIGLLHARFPLFRRKQLEDYWMEALGKDGEKNGKRPKGCVLVSTQVVEQSVDLDADLMVSELAPTDMLLQRMGRLWRHPRESRPAQRAELWIVSETHTIDELRQMTAKQIRNALGVKAWVYSTYVLLRSLDMWLSRTSLTVPNDIRGVLEATYRDGGEEPDGWVTLRNDLEGGRMALRNAALMSANIWQAALNDEENVQTRIGSYKQVSLVLARNAENGVTTLLNGEIATLIGERFDITAARALHRNLVRVPKSIFEKFPYGQETKRYVRGEQVLVLVSPDGIIQADGLKTGTTLSWSDDVGVMIVREEEKETLDEPCD